MRQPFVMFTVTRMFLNQMFWSHKKYKKKVSLLFYAAQLLFCIKKKAFQKMCIDF